MTTKIIITPANHGANRGTVQRLVSGGMPKTVRVVTVGGSPNRPVSKTSVVTLPLNGSVLKSVKQGSVLSNKEEVRPVFKRAYQTSENITYMSSGSISPKKRQRLDHLTPDQKNQRRKLKNRVAAQTARDRKKLQMDGLEARVTALERENDKLAQQNEFLQKQNDLLSTQNALLQERLREEPDQKTGRQPSAGAVASSTSIESAALISGPRQKGQDVRTAALLTLSLVSWASFQVVLATQAVNLLTFLSCSPAQSLEIARRMKPTRRPPALEWWGPKQKSWRPAMIG